MSMDISLLFYLYIYLLLNKLIFYNFLIDIDYLINKINKIY